MTRYLYTPYIKLKCVTRARSRNSIHYHPIGTTSLQADRRQVIIISIFDSDSLSIRELSNLESACLELGIRTVLLQTHRSARGERSTD